MIVSFDDRPPTSGLTITGIGSRQIPANDRLATIVGQIGKLASLRGWTLRSGAAFGMDAMFESAWTGSKEIFIPWNGFSGRHGGVNGAINVTDAQILQSAQTLAASVHPKWSGLTRGGKALHTRNVFQVLGQTIDHASDLCIFYAPIDFNGNVKGGTRTAVELAKRNNVPTYNLMITSDVIELGDALGIEWTHST